MVVRLNNFGFIGIETFGFVPDYYVSGRLEGNIYLYTGNGETLGLVKREAFASYEELSAWMESIINKAIETGCVDLHRDTDKIELFE